MTESFGDHVRRFLKREAFYVLILLAVVAFHGVRTARMLAAEERETMLEPVFLDRLEERCQARAKALMAEGRPAGYFAAGVRLASSGAFWAGLATLVTIAATWVARGRLLPRAPHRPPPWGLWDVLKLAGLTAAGGMVFAAILKAEGMPAFLTPRPSLAHLLTSALLIGAMVLIVRDERGGCLADLGLRGGRIGRAVGLGALAFLAVQPVMLGLAWVHQELSHAYSQTIPPLTLQEPLHALLVTPSRWTVGLTCLVAAVVAPVAEEMLFRGFLQPALGRWLPPGMTLLVAAMFFAASHADLFVLAPMLALGLVLGYLYERTGSLIAPITTHVLFNVASLVGLLACRAVS